MPGLLRGVARTAVIAGTATSVSNRVSRRQANRWAAQDQQQQDSRRRRRSTEPAPPAAGAAADPIAQLRELAQLRDEGDPHRRGVRGREGQDPRVREPAVSQDAGSPPLGSTADSGRWTGWVVFASIMLVVVGVHQHHPGARRALRTTLFFVARSGDQLLIADFDTWGVVLLVWGAAQAVRRPGGSTAAHGSARVARDHRGQHQHPRSRRCSSPPYPIWSVMIIALDVIVIYALTARWAEARSGL